jgi:hypothetical protein
VIPQPRCPPGQQQAGHIVLQEDTDGHRSGAQAGPGDADTPEGGQVSGDDGPVRRRICCHQDLLTLPR